MAVSSSSRWRGDQGPQELGHLAGARARLPRTAGWLATKSNMDPTLARIEELTAAAPWCRTPPGGRGRRPGRRVVGDQEGPWTTRRCSIAMVPLSVLEPLASRSAGLAPADALADTARSAPVIEQLGYRRIWWPDATACRPWPARRPRNDRAPGRRRPRAAHRRRRGPAPQPCTPGRRRTVRPPRGPSTRSHRPRAPCAPGADQVTARALRRAGDLGADTFPPTWWSSSVPGRQRRPAEHPAPVPGRGYLPEVWLLGSSTFSAQLAGVLGLPFSFAYHFAPDQLDQALESYRTRYRPSFLLEQPHVMVAVSALCAPSDEEARWLSGPSALSILQLRTGSSGRSPHRRRPTPTGTRRRSGPSSTSATSSTWSATPTVVHTGTDGARAPDRRRRDHAVDAGPLLESPGPLPDPGGRAVDHGSTHGIDVGGVSSPDGPAVTPVTSMAVRQYLLGDEGEVLEVEKIEDLEVGALGPGLGIGGQLGRHLVGGAAESVGAQLVPPHDRWPRARRPSPQRYGHSTRPGRRSTPLDAGSRPTDPQAERTRSNWERVSSSDEKARLNSAA